MQRMTIEATSKENDYSKQCDDDDDDDDD